MVTSTICHLMDVVHELMGVVKELVRNHHKMCWYPQLLYHYFDMVRSDYFYRRGNTFVVVKPTPLWKAETFSQFIIHQLLDVQLCVWEVCGMNPSANKERKSCATPSPMFQHFKLCSHNGVLQRMSPFLLYRVNLFISLRGFCDYSCS